VLFVPFHRGFLCSLCQLTSYIDGIENIYAMDADGSNVVNLTNSPGHDYEPAWSPDGTKIAFSSSREGNNEIYVMNIDGMNIDDFHKSKFPI